MTATLTASRAQEILSASRGKRIAVVGDIMLDEFVWGKVSRISPEAPVPVVEIERQSFHLGGAANVSHNLVELGADPVLVGVVGRDAWSERLREVLATTGISAESLCEDPARPTTLKTRIIAHSQQVVRADRESRAPLDRSFEDLAIESVASALARSEALVLSDYSKGMLTPRVLAESIRLARERGLPILVDPKIKSFPLYHEVTLVTPNVAEAEAATGVAIESGEALARAARAILDALGCRAVLITRGEQGMSLFEDAGGAPVHIEAAAREVFDVTGAGDTVIAAAALALTAGGSLLEASVLANQAAGIVVGKLGTATASPEEILRALSAGSGGSR